MTTLHLIAPFHTQLTDEFSHCAFTGKALRFSKMMQGKYRVIEYANEGSESACETKMPILTKKEFAEYYPSLKPGQTHGEYAKIGTTAWHLFNARLINALKSNVKQHDIICHPFGRAHSGLVNEFPQAFHLETGVGYPDAPMNAWRVYESEAWRHHHFGRWENMRSPENGEAIYAHDKGISKGYSWVIPNYYDLEDWPVVEKPRYPYVCFMGRVGTPKGSNVLVAIIEAWDENNPLSPLEFHIAGQGDFDGEILGKIKRESAKKRVVHVGALKGRARAAFVGNAICQLAPTNFIEPFGGAGVEGMLCGTPLLASNFGAYTETIKNGVNGFRCKTLRDWIAGIEWALSTGTFSPNPGRHEIASHAREKYSLQTCATQYTQVIQQLLDLNGKGWYEL